MYQQPGGWGARNQPPYRDFGSRTKVADQQRVHSPWASAFGAFAIAFVVRRVLGFGAGVLSVGTVVVASSRHADVAPRQIVGAVLLLELVIVVGGAVAASRYLRTRAVRHAFLVALGAGLTGVAASLLPIGGPPIGTGLLVDAVVEVGAAVALIRFTGAGVQRP